MDIETKQKIRSWLQEPFDPDTIAQVEKLLAISPQELEDSFSKDLSFGTGGLRGVMGVGTNRMNRYTVRKTTQGLADFLHKKHPVKGLSVVIGFDNRIGSEEFAKETASVLLQNGIDVFLCKMLRPTPYVSFACRHCKADAAVMITASHNPKEYNGYKVYLEDGGQAVPPDDKEILRSISEVPDFTIKQTKRPGTFHEIGREVDEAYLQAILALPIFPEEDKLSGSNLSIVYTPLHGTGITLVPEALHRAGFSSVALVEEQSVVDGNFPTVKVPNPESKEALKMGTDKLLALGADLLLATDPDADRLAVAVLHRGKVEILTGNEIGAICTRYLCQHRKDLPRPAVVISVVTGDLIRRICQHNDVELYEVLTGFKYIGEKIKRWETDPKAPSFLFGAEESYGYLYGTHARDKDAPGTCLLISEIALRWKKEKKTLIDFLHEIYAEYGVCKEEVKSLDFPEGIAGETAVRRLMQNLRENPPSEIGSRNVLSLTDYSDGSLTGLPSSDMLRFTIEDGQTVFIRPSGTEPKVKIYFGAYEPPREDSYQAEQICLEKLRTLVEEFLKKIATVS